MTVYETFCGIGGFSLGFKRAGFEIIGGCEIDPYARAVYAKNFGIEPDGDIRKVGKISSEILCGGFPCQDISNANKDAKGLEGERSGLWWELARIIENSSPRWVVLENVPALLGNGMGDILRFFSAVGYHVEWDCLPASAFGSPHVRDRLWIVAHANGFGQQRRSFEGNSSTETTKRNEQPAGFLQTGSWSQLPKASIFGMDDGIPFRSHRLKCLGNAIVPQISQWIAQRIKELDLSQQSSTTGKRGMNVKL